MESKQITGLDAVEDLARNLRLDKVLAEPIASARRSMRGLEALSSGVSASFAIELGAVAIEATALAFSLALIKSHTVSRVASGVARHAAPFAGLDAAAEAEQKRRETRHLDAELAHGIGGRLVQMGPPVPGSRAAAEAELMRRGAAEMGAHRAAVEAKPLQDLAAIIRDA